MISLEDQVDWEILSGLGEHRVVCDRVYRAVPRGILAQPIATNANLLTIYNEAMGDNFENRSLGSKKKINPFSCVDRGLTERAGLLLERYLEKMGLIEDTPYNNYVRNFNEGK